MAKADLLKMAFCQKEKNCALGGACPFLLEYQYVLFCVSEILGEGCQIEKLPLCGEDSGSDDEESRKTAAFAVGPCLPGFG